MTDDVPHPHRRDRLWPRRLLRRRAPAEGRLGRACRGRHDRATADALGPRPLGRRARPPEDQVGHARLREDRRTSALPLLRQRQLRRARLAARSCSSHYHAIVYATGSPSDRPLGIPGEDLPGSHAATEFVGWYNGHPDHTDLEVDLCAAERAVVIGNGNVAIDVARMLVLAPAELAPTDTADHALEVLGRSRVSGGRRRRPPRAGPGGLHEPRAARARRAADADVIVDPAELERALAVHDAGGRARCDAAAQRRDPALLRAAPAGGQPKRIVLRFLLSPTALRGRRARPSRRGRAGPQRARRRRRRRAARPRHRRARDDRGRPRCSARSATAASRCPACPSTSARR